MPHHSTPSTFINPSCDLPKSSCCGSMDPCLTLKGLRSHSPSSDMTLNHLDIHPT